MAARAAEQQKARVAEAKLQQAMALKALSLRVSAFLRRKPSTEWSEKEKRALEKLFPLPEEDLELVERYYALPAAAFPTGRDGQAQDFRRRDLATLLNNWPGEVDRATRHFGSNGHSSRGPSSSKSHDPAPYEIAAWLDTMPSYESKRGEWTAWDHLPPFAQEEFWRYRRTAPLAVDPALWRTFVTSPDHLEYRSLATHPTPKTEADVSVNVMPDWKRFKRTAPAAVTLDQLRAFIAASPDHDRFRSIFNDPPTTIDQLPPSIRERFAAWTARQK